MHNAITVDIELKADVSHGVDTLLTYTMHLRRKPLYYVVNLIIPCCLFFFIAVSMFLLRPNCSSRLGLSTLTIFVFLQKYQ